MKKSTGQPEQLLLAVADMASKEVKIYSAFLPAVSLSAWAAKVCATIRGKIKEASAYTWGQRNRGVDHSSCYTHCTALDPVSEY